MKYTIEFVSKYEIGDIVSYSDKSGTNTIGIINSIEFDEKEYKFVYKIINDYHISYDNEAIIMEFSEGVTEDKILTRANNNLKVLLMKEEMQKFIYKQDEYYPSTH